MRLSHNIASLNIYSSYAKVLKNQSKALNEISSGLKVSSSADDPGAMAKNDQITMQLRGLQMASRNSQDGVSMLQTAEGGLDNITSMLQRIRELTVQQQNGTNNDGDKADIQTEMDQLTQGINDIANNTEFNNVKLLDNGNVTDNNNPEYTSMPVGANAGEKVDIPLYNLKNLNIVPGDLNSIDSAISTVTSIQSKYGAIENRFQTTLDNIGEISDKMQESDSNLMDADISGEMMEYAKDNVLSDASNAMMAQSNKLPQEVLQILQNVSSK